MCHSRRPSKTGRLDPIIHKHETSIRYAEAYIKSLTCLCDNCEGMRGRKTREGGGCKRRIVIHFTKWHLKWIVKSGTGQVDTATAQPIYPLSGLLLHILNLGSWASHQYTLQRPKLYTYHHLEEPPCLLQRSSLGP